MEEFKEKINETYKKGLSIVLGLPRSGKTTFINNVYSKVLSGNTIILKQDEFDGDLFFSNLIVDELNSIIKLIECNSHIDNIFIDSIKSWFYSQGSLRKGGISNETFKMLNESNYIANFLNKRIIVIVTPTSNDLKVIEEFVAISASCCSHLLIVDQHQILFDWKKRLSLAEYVKFINNVRN